MKPTHCFNRQNFRVQSISPDLIKPIIEKNHYLHRLSLGVVRACFAVIKIDESRLVGVLVFGEPVRRELSKSISPLVADNEVLELIRVWIEDGHGSNIESWAIAQAFKMLPPERKVVISYADSTHVDEFGRPHIGKIYQALNGYYQELPEVSSQEISLDGVTWLHERTQGRWFGKHNTEQLTSKLGHDFQVRKSVTKYRYFWLVCSEKEKQKILDTLKYPISHYPKTAKSPPTTETIVVE